MKKITKEELLMAYDTCQIQIIDVRSKEEFDQKHIPQAIHIPLEDLAKNTANLSKDHWYVTACGKGGGRSEQGASQLSELGYTAFYLENGTFGWFDH